MNSPNQSDRRDFIKKISLGTGAVTIGLHSPSSVHSQDNEDHDHARKTQYFNMCGFATPKIEIVRIGLMGWETGVKLPLSVCPLSTKWK